MKSIYVLVVSLAFSTSALSASPEGSGEKKRLQLKLLKHQPCNAQPTPSERIRFPSIDQAPLVTDVQRGDGCYSIPGPVTAIKSIRGTMQIYVDVRYGTNSSIEKCTGADSSGCGGVGSCVHCDSCSSMEGVKNKASGFAPVLTSVTPLDCQKGFDAGKYSDLRISFCMPTKEEFLKAQGINEDTWEQYIASGRMVFMTLYVFNNAVNALSTSDLQKIASPSGDQVIGCHRLVGTVYESND